MPHAMPFQRWFPETSANFHISVIAVAHSTTDDTWIAQVGSDSALVGSACACRADAASGIASAQPAASTAAAVTADAVACVPCGLPAVLHTLAVSSAMLGRQADATRLAAQACAMLLLLPAACMRHWSASGRAGAASAARRGQDDIVVCTGSTWTALANPVGARSVWTRLGVRQLECSVKAAARR